MENLSNQQTNELENLIKEIGVTIENSKNSPIEIDTYKKLLQDAEKNFEYLLSIQYDDKKHVMQSIKDYMMEKINSPLEKLKENLKEYPKNPSIMTLSLDKSSIRNIDIIIEDLKKSIHNPSTNENKEGIAELEKLILDIDSLKKPSEIEKAFEIFNDIGKNSQYLDRDNASMNGVEILNPTKESKRSFVELKDELRKHLFQLRSSIISLSDKGIQNIDKTILRITDVIGSLSEKNKTSELTELIKDMNFFKQSSGQEVEASRCKKILNNLENNKRYIDRWNNVQPSVDILSSNINSHYNAQNSAIYNFEQIKNSLGVMLEYIQTNNEPSEIGDFSQGITERKKFDNNSYASDTFGDLELYPTTNHTEPRHAILIEKAEKESQGYANLVMEGGSASCFIVGEDEENLYLITNKHVLFDDEKHALDAVQNIEFEENSGIKLKKDFKCESYISSKKIDIGVVKLPKQYLEITKKIHTTPFSPNLIDNEKLVVYIGNSYVLGTSLSFGVTKNNKSDTESSYIAVETKAMVHPGNSGCPVYSFDIIQNDENFKISHFYVVGMQSRATYGDDRIDPNQIIDGKNYKNMSIRMMQIEEKILENATEEKKKEWEAYKEVNKDECGEKNLERNIKDFFGKDALTGFYEHFPDIDGYFVPSDTIIKEIEIMKKEYPKLSSLNLTILPKDKVEYLGLDEISKSNQMK